MDPIVPTGIAAGAIALVAVMALMRPARGGRMPWAALAIGAGSVAVTIASGLLAGIAPRFLVGLVLPVPSVLVLLDAAAVAAGAGAGLRRLAAALWGIVVFPVTALVPLAMTAGCIAPECRFEDFGAALPLLVSPAAFVLLARPPAGVSEQPRLDRAASRRTVVGGLALWAAAAVWLAHLEGVVDEFVPRILLAALVGPLAGGAGWLLADTLRGTRRSIPRSVVLGMVAGMAATLPAAVSVAPGWLAIAGVLAGGLSALVFSASWIVRTGLAARWGLTVLVASATGFLAPAVSGENTGVIFFARWAVLAPPVLALVGVVAFGVLASLPVWLPARSRSVRSRIPEQLLERP